MKQLFVTYSFILLFAAFGNAQVKAFDKLEMLYDQAHYPIVLKRANKLMDNPEYDYSQIPSLYKSMALFQLSQNEYWFKRHPNALDDAKDLFLKVKSSSDGRKVFEAHIYEVSALKRDLIAWSEDLKRTGKRQAFENVQELMYGLFENVPDIQHEGEIKVEEISSVIAHSTESKEIIHEREQIIDLAKKHVGVPYLWAGEDPKGFDCSGFTSYVLKGVNKELPRRAKDQYEASRKLKQKDVQKGDLVFFDNGSGISHVGIIVSEQGESLKMIHASSSKGIVITNIEDSDYWQKRIFGFGSYLGE